MDCELVLLLHTLVSNFSDCSRVARETLTEISKVLFHPRDAVEHVRRLVVTVSIMYTCRLVG